MTGVLSKLIPATVASNLILDAQLYIPPQEPLKESTKERIDKDAIATILN